VRLGLGEPGVPQWPLAELQLLAEELRRMLLRLQHCLRAVKPFSFVVLSAALALGCDTPPPLASDAFVDDDASSELVDAGQDAAMFQIGAHAPGTIVPDQHGTRLTHPQIVVITYADDPNRATLEADAAWLVTSNWLTTVGAEYGIGSGAVLGNVRLTDNAPVTIQGRDIETLIQGWVTDHTVPRAADGTFTDVLYVLYFPSTTHIRDPDLGDSCVAYGGYHYEIANAGSPFSYAVMPNCPGFAPGLSAIEFEEAAFAHEVIEAATDARPTSHPAFEFSQLGSFVSPWLFVGPELADLCALRVSPVSYPREAGFTASRLWSNAAAMANDRDPCVPANPATPYYALSITPDYIVMASPGSSVTYELDAWTTVPMADFQIYAAASGGTFVPGISVDHTIVNNGDHATLTVTVPAGTPAGSYALVYVEAVVSSTEYSATPVVVYLP
jgi:hypothetical protein